MIHGLVRRRTGPSLPFPAQLVIEFINTQPAVSARITHFSPKMAHFYLPKGQLNLAPEAQITLVFSLVREKMTCQGEVDYFCPAIDEQGRPMMCYGMKLLNITPQQWAVIHLFCQGQLLEMPSPASTVVPEPLRSPEVSLNSTSPVPERLSEPSPTAGLPSKEDFFSKDGSRPSLPPHSSRSYSLSQERIDHLIQTWPADPTPPQKRPEDSRIAVPDGQNHAQAPDLNFLAAADLPAQGTPGVGEELFNQSRESLADILYGEEIPAPGASVNPAPDSSVRQASPQGSSGNRPASCPWPESVPDHSSRPIREAKLNNGTSSSISMDQSMIDRIIRTLKDNK